MMTNKTIMPSDTINHIPTGEKWVVCGVDHERQEVIPCGYPFPSIAKLSDCELIESRYDIEGQPLEQINALKRNGLQRFIDVKSAMFYEII